MRLRLGLAAAAAAAALAPLAAAPDLVWENIEYVRSPDGFDDHGGLDMCPGGGGSQAMCAMNKETGRILLRGCVQCLVNVRTCFDRPGVHFATLPAACRPIDDVESSLAIVDSSGDLSDSAVEAHISAAPNGRLTLTRAATDQWNLHLKGVSLPVQDIGWGWPFLFALAIGMTVYVGGGVAAVGEQACGGQGLRAHPHYENWGALAGLVRDGISSSLGGDGYEPVESDASQGAPFYREKLPSDKPELSAARSALAASIEAAQRVGANPEAPVLR